MLKNKSNRNFFINFLIMIAIYLIISNLPYSAPLTKMGLQNLAILVACIWGWCVLGSIIPSILGCIVFGVISQRGIAAAFMSGFGSYIITMLLPLLMVCGVMVSTGFTKALALKIINSSFANGKPWVLISLMMGASAVLSLVLPGLAVVLVIWDIAYGVFENCGYDKGESLPKHLMLGICSAATFGMMCSHLSTGVIPGVGIIQTMDPTVQFNALAYTGSSILQMIVFLVLNILIIKSIFRPDVTKLYNYKAPEEKVKFTVDQKISGILLLAFVVLVTVPAFMPMGSPVHTFLEGYGLIGFGFLVVVVALLVRHGDGSPMVTFKQIADNGLYWDMIIMLAAIQVVCGSLSTPEFGVSDWLVSIFNPLLANMGTFGAILFLVVLAVVVTNLLDSAVTGLVFTVMTMTIAYSLGINHMGLQAIMLKAAAYGMLLPACSPPLTLLYGKVPDGWIDNKTILKSAAPQIIAAILVFTVGGYLTLDWF